MVFSFLLCAHGVFPGDICFPGYHVTWHPLTVNGIEDTDGNSIIEDNAPRCNLAYVVEPIDIDVFVLLNLLGRAA